MNDCLVGILEQHENLIIDSVAHRIHQAGASHYEDLDGSLLRRRVAQMLGSFGEAAAERAGAFTAYIEGIARERIVEGFFLEEIQTALSVFEENIWRLVTVHIPLEQQVECLARASGIIGAAKDQLAQIYLKVLEETEARAGSGQVRAEYCALGTDSPPMTEEDRTADPDVRRRTGSIGRTPAGRSDRPANGGDTVETE